MFVLTLPGALLAASLVARRWMRPPGAAGWTVAAGFVVGWLIYPPNNTTVGILDALYPGVLIVLIAVAARVGDRQARLLVELQAVLGVVFFGLLMWVSVVPIADDANLVLKEHYGTRSAPDDFGYLPGAAVLLLGLIVVAFDLRRTGLSPPPTPATSRPPPEGTPP
jgi:hypothetical protein